MIQGSSDYASVPRFCKNEVNTNVIIEIYLYDATTTFVSVQHWESDIADGKAYVGRCEANNNVGQGVKWSADRAQAWEMQDGRPVRSIALEEAAQIAARIGLPVP